MKTKMHVCLLFLTALCTLVSTGCQRKSGNIWDANQTGAKYKQEGNSTALWDSSKDGGPAEEEFVHLNDDDLKSQFTDVAAPAPSRELGEKGMPRADQFETPRGELASIFTPIFFNTDEYTVKDKDYLNALRRVAVYLKA